MMKRRRYLCVAAVLVAAVALIFAVIISHRDIKLRKTVSFVSLMLDVEVGVTFSLDSKKWSCPLVCPLEINVATPPRRKLDDVRSYLRLGCVGLDLVFAHYRGPDSIR